jgi:hypothetical protein
MRTEFAVGLVKNWGCDITLGPIPASYRGTTEIDFSQMLTAMDQEVEHNEVF